MCRKIDYFRLKTILHDLKIDSQHDGKGALLFRLLNQQHRKGGSDKNSKELERCHFLEEIVNKLKVHRSQARIEFKWWS